MPTPLRATTGPAGSRTAVLARAEAVVWERRATIVEDLELCLAWADLHRDPPTSDVPGGDRLVQLGGEGVPGISDLCLDELSIARQVHVANTRAAMADALDLRHRLPQLWAALRRLECEPWLARKIVRMSRRLSLDAVGLVDRAVAAALHQAPSRVLAIAEAKIIEADAAGYEAELAERATQHGVWLGRLRPADPDDPDSGRGTQTIFAKLSPEDAWWVDRTIAEIADLLETDEALRAQHAPALADLPDGTVPSKDQLRAAALGLLGKPDVAAKVLGLAGGDTRRRRATVYVHLHASTIGARDGVARVEGLGPLLATRLRHLLGDTPVDLKPVIDLNTGTSVNGYEHPASMRERVLLRNAGDVFPHASSLSRNADLDHVVPYDPGGPPGQTSDTNTAPLSRRSHRAKTHADYQVEQLGPATYLWTTPHGLTRLVDHTGTHPVTDLEVRLLRVLHAPAA